jgi:hypothetical protein
MSVTLAAMLSLAPWVGDAGESPEAREARLAPYARAVDAATGSLALRAALVALAWHETKMARYVTEGRCHDGPPGQRCDNGKARGPWQLHGWCKATTPEGEAVCAAGMLSYMLTRCDGDWPEAFGAYGTGGRCVALTAREETRQRLLRRFR